MVVLVVKDKNGEYCTRLDNKKGPNLFDCQVCQQKFIFSLHHDVSLKNRFMKIIIIWANGGFRIINHLMSLFVPHYHYKFITINFLINFLENTPKNCDENVDDKIKKDDN